MADTHRIRRVLVTVDACNHRWPEAIRYAANLAKAMNAELHTVFVEDDDVATAAELPFTVEISIQRAKRQSFLPEDLNRVQRQVIQRIRTAFESTLKEAQLQGGFTTARRQQLLETFRQGDIFWLRRQTSIARLPLQASPLRETLYLVYEDTDNADNLLAVAGRLFQKQYRNLVVFNLSTTDNEALVDLFVGYGKPVKCVCLPAATGLKELLGLTVNSSSNTLLLSNDSTISDEPEALLNRFNDCRFEVLLIK